MALSAVMGIADYRRCGDSAGDPRASLRFSDEYALMTLAMHWRRQDGAALDSAAITLARCAALDERRMVLNGLG